MSLWEIVKIKNPKFTLTEKDVELVEESSLISEGGESFLVFKSKKSRKFYILFYKVDSTDIISILINPLSIKIIQKNELEVLLCNIYNKWVVVNFSNNVLTTEEAVKDWLENFE